MSNFLEKNIPNNHNGGIILNQKIDINNTKIIANEMQECIIKGNIDKYSFSTNLISCEFFSSDINQNFNELDAKNSFFNNLNFYKNFNDNFITKCIFKNVNFVNSILYNTSFNDCTFINCKFENSNLKNTTFKDNSFNQCQFTNCETNNKIFEHCIFDETNFYKLNLKEQSLTQNFGLQKHQFSNSTINNLQVENINFKDLFRKNDFENFNIEYFFEKDINKSEFLHNIVTFNFNFEIHQLNYNFIFVCLTQFAKFINNLYNKNILIAYFPLKLYLSLEDIKEKIPYTDETMLSIENITVSSMILSQTYQNLILFINNKNSIIFLTHSNIKQEEVHSFLNELKLNIEIKRFEKYNSPNLVELISQNYMEITMLLSIVFASDFKFEITKYIESEKLLSMNTNLDKKNQNNLSYEMLFLLNAPNMFNAKINYKLNLSYIIKLRKILLKVLSFNEKSQ